MGLVHSQTLLARLTTDATLRERFFADSVRVGLEFGLGPEEAAQLALLSARQAEQFAGSLRKKRLGEVGKLLSLSRLVLSQAAFSRSSRISGMAANVHMNWAAAPLERKAGRADGRPAR